MDGIGRIMRVLGLAGVLAGTLLPGGASHAQEAPAPFAPVTIANFGPITTNQPQVAWVAIGGDWAAYAARQPGCGHCQGTINALYLQNLATSQRIAIHPAIAQAPTNTLSNIGATDLLWRAHKLFWRQPDPVSAPPPQGFTFTPGSYNCSQCYYDPATGQGGAWAIVLPQPDDFTPYAQLESGPPPTYLPKTVTLDGPTLLGKPRRITLPATENANDPIAGDGGRLIYVVLNGGNTRQGGVYGAEQLIRVAWISSLPPAFGNVWAKADAAVKAGTAPRTWLWGPAPRYIATEAYDGGTRQVVYYDKSRMEINHPTSDHADPYYVTNGLLVADDRRADPGGRYGGDQRQRGLYPAGRGRPAQRQPPQPQLRRPRGCYEPARRPPGAQSYR